jgi:hypothetical protein
MTNHSALDFKYGRYLVDRWMSHILSAFLTALRASPCMRVVQARMGIKARVGAGALNGLNYLRMLGAPRTFVKSLVLDLCRPRKSMLFDDGAAKDLSMVGLLEYGEIRTQHGLGCQRANLTWVRERSCLEAITL